MECGYIMNLVSLYRIYTHSPVKCRKLLKILLCIGIRTECPDYFVVYSKFEAATSWMPVFLILEIRQEYVSCPLFGSQFRNGREKIMMKK